MKQKQKPSSNIPHAIKKTASVAAKISLITSLTGCGVRQFFIDNPFTSHQTSTQPIRSCIGFQYPEAFQFIFQSPFRHNFNVQDGMKGSDLNYITDLQDMFPFKLLDAEVESILEGLTEDLMALQNKTLKSTTTPSIEQQTQNIAGVLASYVEKIKAIYPKVPSCYQASSASRAAIMFYGQQLSDFAERHGKSFLLNPGEIEIEKGKYLLVVSIAQGRQIHTAELSFTNPENVSLHITQGEQQKGMESIRQGVAVNKQYIEDHGLAESGVHLKSPISYKELIFESIHDPAFGHFRMNGRAVGNGVQIYTFDEEKRDDSELLSTITHELVHVFSQKLEGRLLPLMQKHNFALPTEVQHLEWNSQLSFIRILESLAEGSEIKGHEMHSSPEQFTEFIMKWHRETPAREYVLGKELFQMALKTAWGIDLTLLSEEDAKNMLIKKIENDVEKTKLTTEYVSHWKKALSDFEEIVQKN